MSTNKRVLRLLVTHGNEWKVNIAVPASLARLARLGGIPEFVADRHGIDLNEILDGIEEIPDGKVIDVIDKMSGDHVQIYLETPDDTEVESADAARTEARV